MTLARLNTWSADGCVVCQLKEFFKIQPEEGVVGALGRT